MITLLYSSYSHPLPPSLPNSNRHPSQQIHLSTSNTHRMLHPDTASLPPSTRLVPPVSPPCSSLQQCNRSHSLLPVLSPSPRDPQQRKVARTSSLAPPSQSHRSSPKLHLNLSRLCQMGCSLWEDLTKSSPREGRSSLLHQPSCCREPSFYRHRGQRRFCPRVRSFQVGRFCTTGKLYRAGRSSLGHTCFPVASFSRVGKLFKVGKCCKEVKLYKETRS